MSWLEALKEYSKESGKWAVPKKGSPEYEAVKKIQDRMDGVVEKKVVEKKKFVKKVEKVIEAPPREPVKKLTKEEHFEEKVKPRIEKLKKLQAEKDEADKKKKELREKYDAEEKAKKAKLRAKRPQEEIDVEKALLKSKVEASKAEAKALRAEIDAKKDVKPRGKKVIEEVVEVAPPAPKVRKSRVSKAKMTIEQTPVVLEFK